MKEQRVSVPYLGNSGREKTLPADAFPPWMLMSHTVLKGFQLLLYSHLKARREGEQKMHHV